MTHHHVQTKSEIADLLSAAGTRPQRKLGQNFLIDGNLLRRLITAAEIGLDDAVLEVGAGTGALTERFAELAKAVVSVEIDPRLHAIVARRIAKCSNVTLIRCDALASKHRIAPQVCDALAAARETAPGRMMLVANLPFQIATPLLMNLLLGPQPFDRFCFTVQKEMADRITAKADTREYGPVSIALQATCRIDRIASLPRSVFWPRPAVESTMLRIDVVSNPFETTERLAQFVARVRTCFLHRRKTLKFNVSHAFGEKARDDLAGDFDLRRRPQSMTVEEWITIGRRLESMTPAES